MTATIEILSLDEIDLEGTPPCQVKYGSGCCGKPSACRVKWTCGNCDVTEIVFICARDRDRWMQLWCTLCWTPATPYVLT